MVYVFTEDIDQLKYRTIIGSDNDETERMYTIRASNNTDFVVSGYVEGNLSTNSPDYLVNEIDNSRSDKEGYIAKFTNYNQMTFGTYVGGNRDDVINDMHLLRDGRVVFCGFADRNNGLPTRVNDVGASSASYGDDNGIFGVIPANGGSFSVFSVIGGNNDDRLNGMTLNEAEDTMFFTGYTNSNNFYLGNTGLFSPHQSSRNGDDDIIVGSSPVTGAASGGQWRATLIGGSNEERGLVIRTVYTGVQRYLLIFGYNDDGGITTINPDAGTFFSSANQGGLDLMFLTVTKDMESLVSSTYFGGTRNDYFGNTGSIRGSNHVFLQGGTNAVMAATLHSTTTTHVPTIIGPSTGPGTVFDYTKSSGTDDSHIIMKLDYSGVIEEDLDFGDIPDGYGVAFNAIDSLVMLGSLVDDETTYPSLMGADANYDDTCGVNDDDGLLTGTLFRRTDAIFSMDVAVFNNSGEDAVVITYFDLNADGDFEDANEVVFDTVATNASLQTITVDVISPGYNNIVPGPTYMRTQVARLSQLPATTAEILLNPVFGSGEVEGYLVEVLDVDHGDLPEEYVSSSVGFFQSTDSRAVWLGGNSPIGEQWANHSNNATGDGAEEDGLIMPLTAHSGNSEVFKVVVNAAVPGTKVYFKLWIDWDKDYAWDSYHGDSGIVGTTDTISFTMFVPISYDSSSINVRLLATDDYSTFMNATTPIASFFNGEVEDNFSAPLPLPVTITTFIANKDEDFVKLHWRTAQEINNSHFDIERSSNLEDWTVIGSVTGAGTSHEISEYDYIDHAPVNGVNYYRLNQFDFNGINQYSDIRQVKFSEGSIDNIIVSPNPVTDVFEVNLGESASGTAEVVDQQGRVIHTLDIVKGSAKMDLSNYESGIYFLRIMINNNYEIKKLIKL